MKSSVLFAVLGFVVGAFCAVSCSQSGTGSCDANNCPTGCCFQGSCQAGTDTTACGTGGAACAACGAGTSCTRGACVAAGTDSGNPGNDSGNPGTDSGNPGNDSGNPGTDSGNPGSDGGNPGNDAGNPGSDGGHVIKTVFLIVMENTDWADVLASNSGGTSVTPFIHALLDAGAHSENYHDPGVHPSEPNYLWLEAGDNLGITADGTPSSDHQATTQHLVTLLQNAGVSWTSWQEDIDGGSCPLSGVNEYAPKHNPMVYFDDVTNMNDPNSANCIAHVRPYSELQARLAANTVPQYNFITPNLCHDMHGDSNCSNGCGAFTLSGDSACDGPGDTWLAAEVPKIMASQAYQNGGVILITWDESEPSFTCGFTPGCPIGMIVLSPYAKVRYSSTTFHDHSSTVRTLQEIFNVSPYLRGAAADAGDLSEFFTRFP